MPTMKSLPTLAAAAALFLGFSAPASAEMVPYRTIGHWTLRADNELCDAQGSFADGTRLDLSINSHAALVFTVVNPRWSIPRGKYEIMTQVDRSPSRTNEADSLGDRVMWWVPVSEEAVNLLSYGRTLYVKLGQTTLSYNLALSEAVLKSLAQCAAPRMAAANPFSGSPPAARAETPASTDTPSNPFRRL